MNPEDRQAQELARTIENFLAKSREVQAVNSILQQAGWQVAVVVEFVKPKQPTVQVPLDTLTAKDEDFCKAVGIAKFW